MSRLTVYITVNRDTLIRARGSSIERKDKIPVDRVNEFRGIHGLTGDGNLWFENKEL